MDIDFQGGNLLFSLLRFIIGAGAFGLFLWLLMDLLEVFKKRLPKSTNGLWKFWRNFVIKSFIVLAVIVSFGVMKSNAPRITLEYQEREAVQPQGEVSPDSKPWREGWEEREKRMRELDAETRGRTSADD